MLLYVCATVHIGPGSEDCADRLFIGQVEVVVLVVRSLVGVAVRSDVTVEPPIASGNFGQQPGAGA